MFLLGLTVETTHLPGTQQMLVVSALSQKPAKEVKFKLNGSEEEISVVDYMHRQYQMVRIQNPGLPCAIQHRAPRKNYFPLELLKIL